MDLRPCRGHPRPGVQPCGSESRSTATAGTREIKLADEFPMHVVCQWIGNSQPIAAKRYLQVTADHFTKAMQKALQQPAVLPRTGSQSDLALSTQAPVLHGDAANCEKVPEGQAPRVGFEQSADSPRRVAKPKRGAANSAAAGDDSPPIDRVFPCRIGFQLRGRSSGCRNRNEFSPHHLYNIPDIQIPRSCISSAAMPQRRLSAMAQCNCDFG